MQILQTEGVILKVLDFRDYDQIITVFTSEEELSNGSIRENPPANLNFLL